MPFNENNQHCQECDCYTCDLRGTDGCLEYHDDGSTYCDQCDNRSHIRCVWAPDQADE